MFCKRRRLPSPATLLEEGGSYNYKQAAYFYPATEKKSYWRYVKVVLTFIIFVATTACAYHTWEINTKLNRAITEAIYTLTNNNEEVCISSKELSEGARDVPFIVVSSKKNNNHHLILLYPEIIELQGDFILATVHDRSCSKPVTTRRRTRAVVSFVSGSSWITRVFRYREKMRFYQPVSVCLQHALDTSSIETCDRSGI